MSRHQTPMFCVLRSFFNLPFHAAFKICHWKKNQQMKIPSNWNDEVEKNRLLGFIANDIYWLSNVDFIKMMEFVRIFFFVSLETFRSIFFFSNSIALDWNHSHSNQLCLIVNQREKNCIESFVDLNEWVEANGEKIEKKNYLFSILCVQLQALAIFNIVEFRFDFSQFFKNYTSIASQAPGFLFAWEHVFMLTKHFSRWIASTMNDTRKKNIHGSYQ